VKKRRGIHGTVYNETMRHAKGMHRRPPASKRTEATPHPMTKGHLGKKRKMGSRAY